VVSYGNVDDVGDIGTQRSTTRYTSLLDSSAIIWDNKKQSTITLSTTMVEYMADTHVANKAIWFLTTIF
jgi:hypothetical protein